MTVPIHRGMIELRWTAKRAGFTSEMTSRRAERVVNRGIPEFVGLRGYP